MLFFPLDLKAAHGNKSKLVQSPETSNYTEASLLAARERTKLLEAFKGQAPPAAPKARHDH